MFKLAIPVLHVSASKQAESFYRTKLGFTQAFAYRPDETRADPCYMGFSRDGVLIHVSSFSGDGVSGGVVVLVVGERRCATQRACRQGCTDRAGADGSDVGQSRDVRKRPGQQLRPVHSTQQAVNGKVQSIVPQFQEIRSP